MSDTLAIAVVTSTIRHLLDEALAGSEPGAVDGATVTTVHPRELQHERGSGGSPSGLNIHLYDVSWNQTTSIRRLPPTGPERTTEQRSSVALDLHYLVTAHGDDAALEGQRLLALAARALAAAPVLTRPVIAAAMSRYGAGDLAFLASSDLADQPEAVRLTPASQPIDATSALWRALSTPYLPSLTYTASVVLL